MNDVIVTISIHSTCDEPTDTNSVLLDWDYSYRIPWVDWVFGLACRRYDDLLRKLADVG